MLSHRLKKMHKFAKNALALTVSLMTVLYISAAAAYLYAPHAPNYMGALLLHRAFMEVAPATFAAGVCAALISDMALNKRDDDAD